jgi:putative tryptophan/tyrosine transport system substrate-binding protein
MRRREFIRVLGGAAVSWPLPTLAQEPVTPTIGFISSGTPDTFEDMAAAFRQGLKEIGYIDGLNVAIEYRWADGQYDRLPAQADELVKRRVALIFASGGVGPTRAAKAATTTVPIVFTAAYDPVAFGLVGSLNRPEGNVTGVTFFAGMLGAKRLELLRDLLPKATVVAMLANPDNPNIDNEAADVRAAARALGMQLQVVTASTDGEIDATFARLAGQTTDALFVHADPFFQTRSNQIVALAARYAVPTIYPNRAFTTAGGLLSYATSQTDAYRQAGIYAGRILKGAKPADLPVVQPTKFDLVINLKTAKALGLEVPPTLLARADEVIE